MTENTSSRPDEIPMETLELMAAAWKWHEKTLTILRSTTSIVSVISSVFLIRIIIKSKQRLSTTFHRLLLGMAISDIMFSLPMATFGVMSPSSDNGWIWNAHGNQASCNAQGFFITTGMYSTLCYSCSLNFYYLFKVKYNKSDSYIRNKIEPFLHFIPILLGLYFSITGLFSHNYNDKGVGVCGIVAVYDPPHCIGYEPGEVREGFEIPCGRGQQNESYYYWTNVVVIFTVPILVGITLGMVYSHVNKQEKSMTRYDQAGQQPTSQHYSRAVLHKAYAYSISFFLSWVWRLGASIMYLAGAGVPLWYAYLWYVTTVCFRPAF